MIGRAVIVIIVVVIMAVTIIHHAQIVEKKISFVYCVITCGCGEKQGGIIIFFFFTMFRSTPSFDLRAPVRPIRSLARSHKRNSWCGLSQAYRRRPPV